MSTKSELKGFFEDGDTPDSIQFGDLIDSTLNLSESGQQVLQGTLSASALLSNTYNLSAFGFEGIVTTTLTESNQFGNSPDDIHGFTGSFQVLNTGSIPSFFTGSAPVIIGKRTTTLVNGGLEIFKPFTMGTITNQVSQSRSASLIITGAKDVLGVIDFGHLAFDTNEILQFGHNLSIASFTDESHGLGRGNITFIHNVNANTQHTQSLFLSSSGNVAIGNTSPVSKLDVGGDLNVQSHITASGDISASGNILADGGRFYAGGIISNGSTVLGNSSNDTHKFNGDITSSNNISSSGTLFTSASLKPDDNNLKVLLIDTTTGQVYHTGSFSGDGVGVASSGDDDFSIESGFLTSSRAIQITSSNSSISPLSVSRAATNPVLHVNPSKGHVGINTSQNLNNRASAEANTGNVGEFFVNGPIRVRNNDARIYLEDNGSEDSNITHNTSIFRLQNDNGEFKIINSSANEGGNFGYTFFSVQGGGRKSTALSDQGSIKMRIITDSVSSFGGSGTHEVGTSLFVIGNESFGIGENTRTGINTDDFNDLAYALNVKGDINAIGGTVRAAGSALSSDIRLKENIKDLEPQLNIIKKLQPRKYDWKKEAKIEKRSDIGFVAQEIQKVIPNLVLEGKDKDKTLSISYSKLTPILVKAIQEQQEIIESLTKRIENLEKK